MPPIPPSKTASSALSLHSAHGLLRARLLHAADTQAARIACWREIVGAAQAADCRRLLLIDRAHGSRIGVGELAELVVLLRAQASAFDRIAVVEPAQASRATMSHAEPLARALGIPVKVFETERAAAEWLHEAES